jgi:hypothetical protein
MAVDHFTTWGPLSSVYNISGTRQCYSHWSLFGRVVYGGELRRLGILDLTALWGMRRTWSLFTNKADFSILVGIDLRVIVSPGAHE